VVCPKDSHYEKTVSNMQEVRARDGQLIGVLTIGDHEAAALCTGDGETVADVVLIPQAEPEVLPLLTVIPLKLFSYYVADMKGTDVDQPRNLAKTVTVE
jgi:glutamine---fructose-6-phosphate transaminase (isomerizing)